MTPAGPGDRIAHYPSQRSGSFNLKLRPLGVAGSHGRFASRRVTTESAAASLTFDHAPYLQPDQSHRVKYRRFLPWDTTLFLLHPRSMFSILVFRCRRGHPDQLFIPPAQIVVLAATEHVPENYLKMLWRDRRIVQGCAPHSRHSCTSHHLRLARRDSLRSISHSEFSLRK